MPSEGLDLCFLYRGLEPAARTVCPATDKLGFAVQASQVKERSKRCRIQWYVARPTALVEWDREHAPLEIHISSRRFILLAAAQTSVNRKIEFGLVFWKFLPNYVSHHGFFLR